VLDPDALGKLGENYFGALCAGANLTYNSSLNWDRAGWDFIIDFQLDESGVVPLDRRKSPISCRVQQKTIYASSKSVTLALKMAERLAKDPMPTFISIFKVDEANKVTESYLVHMSGGRLASILKRLREENDVRSSEDLKDKTISFTPTDDEKIEFSSAALLAELSKHIGNDIHAYEEQKKKELATIGFEDMPYSGKFLVNAVDQAAFNDMFLGLATEVEVQNMEITETRFGITLPESVSKKAKISINPIPFDDFTAKFEDDLTEEPAVFEGKAFRTPSGPDRRMLFECHFIKIMIELSEDGSRISFDSDLGKVGSAFEWSNYWKAVSVCARKTGQVELRLKSQEMAVTLDLKKAMVEVPDNKAEAFLLLFETLEKIQRRVGISSGKKLSFDDVLNANREIEFVRRIMDGDDLGLKMQVEGAPEQILLIAKEIIFAFTLKVGNEVTACYAIANADVTPIEGGALLQVRDMVLKKFGVVASKEQFKSFIDSAKQRESIETVLTGGHFGMSDG
jgi:hypothetical protein